MFDTPQWDFTQRAYWTKRERPKTGSVMWKDYQLKTRLMKRLQRESKTIFKYIVIYGPNQDVHVCSIWSTRNDWKLIDLWAQTWQSEDSLSLKHWKQVTGLHVSMILLWKKEASLIAINKKVRCNPDRGESCLCCSCLAGMLRSMRWCWCSRPRMVWWCRLFSYLFLKWEILLWF